MDVMDLEKYVFNKDLIVRNIGETIMVYNPQNGDMYEMNETAALLIAHLKTGISGKDIISDICKEYDVNSDVVREDFAPLLDRLVEIGLLDPEN